MVFKRGAGFKNLNNPIIVELNKLGYTANNVHKLLECSKGKGYDLLKRPESLKLGQIKSICFALNKPLGYVLNQLMFTPSRSGHWLDEDYNPGIHIENLKKG